MLSHDKSTEFLQLSRYCVGALSAAAVCRVIVSRVGRQACENRQVGTELRYVTAEGDSVVTTLGEVDVDRSVRRAAGAPRAHRRRSAALQRVVLVSDERRARAV